MRKREAFTEVDSGIHGNTLWATFTIPVGQWSPASGVKRRSSMTEEQKAEAAERLRNLRPQRATAA